MFVGKTDLGGLAINVNVSVVAVCPNGLLATLESNISLDVLQQLAVTLFVGPLYSTHQLYCSDSLFKAFLLSGLGELFVYLCPFVILVLRSIRQVILCAADLAVMQIFKL